MADYHQLFDKFDPPFEHFERGLLGDAFAEELAATSRLWFSSGYDQGIAAYLNFFLLKDFIVTHDTAYPPRFASFRSMAKSFYRTDLFVRDVTDSGRTPTGGISSEKVRRELRGIMARHRQLEIPLWMMSYFGFQLLECVDHHSATITEEERQLHLDYMAKAFRIMGLPFSNDRTLMEGFCRDVEARHAGRSENLEKHAHNILVLGEMVGVSSDRETILGMLPDATRAVFAPIHASVRPTLVRRIFCRAAGRLLMPQAIGTPRTAVPVEG